MLQERFLLMSYKIDNNLLCVGTRRSCLPISSPNQYDANVERKKGKKNDGFASRGDVG